MNAPSAAALIASQRRAERRFLAEPVPLTGFSDLEVAAEEAAEQVELLRQQAQDDRDEVLRERQDAERARYGWNSGE